MNKPNWIDTDKNKMNANQYFKEMEVEFPDIVHGINWDEDLHHLRMATFARYTIDQILSNNVEELLKCFNFQEARISRLDSDLYNALNVSYCEDILIEVDPDIMESKQLLMHKQLRSIYTNYKEYYSKLMSED